MNSPTNMGSQNGFDNHSHLGLRLSSCSPLWPGCHDSPNQGSRKMCPTQKAGCTSSERKHGGCFSKRSPFWMCVLFSRRTRRKEHPLLLFRLRKFVSTFVNILNTPKSHTQKKLTSQIEWTPKARTSSSSSNFLTPRPDA